MSDGDDKINLEQANIIPYVLILDQYYGPKVLDMVEFNKYLDMHWVVYSYDPTAEFPIEDEIEVIEAKRCELEDFRNY